MVYKSLKKEVLHHVTTPREPASFTSASLLRKRYFKKSSLKHMEDALQSSDVYTKSKSFNKNFPDCKTHMWSSEKQWQIDLIAMQPFKKYNQGHGYILEGIEVFSRFAFAQPLQNKTGEAVPEAFKTITPLGPCSGPCQ